MESETSTGILHSMLGPYRVLRGNRNLSLLFGGQVVSAFGDWLYVLALGILAYEITGSATVVAVLTFARLLPYAVLLPLSGILADRGDRKVLMISADLGRGLCMFGLLFTGSEETLWIAYPLVFVSTVFSSLFKPAMSSVLPVLAGDERESDTSEQHLEPDGLRGVRAGSGARRSPRPARSAGACVRDQRLDLPRLRRDARLRTDSTARSSGANRG